jgi:hypothetical protein
MDRSKTISILEGIKNGVIKAEDLKNLLNKKQVDPNHIPLNLPEGPQTEIKIRSTYEDIILDYPWSPEDIQVPLPGGRGYVNEIPVVIAKRSDRRFKHLDSDSHYLVKISDPGFLRLVFGKYDGKMTFRQVEDEGFWDY